MVRYGALAGLLPFLGSALAWYFGWLSLQPFLLYSAIIVSFLAGVLWWHGLSAAPHRADREEDVPLAALPENTASLTVALAVPAVAWAATFLPDVWNVLILGSLYLLVWVWEMLTLRSVYRRAYLLLRTALTLIVVLVHGGIWATL